MRGFLSLITVLQNKSILITHGRTDGHTKQSSLTVNCMTTAIPSEVCWYISCCLIFDLAIVCCPILHEQLIRFPLRRGVGVGVIEQVLYAEQHLLDGNSRSPILVLVEDAETYRTRRVNVRVKERRHELTLRRLRWVLFREIEHHFEHAARPQSSCIHHKSLNRDCV